MSKRRWTKKRGVFKRLRERDVRLFKRIYGEMVAPDWVKEIMVASTLEAEEKVFIKRSLI